MNKDQIRRYACLALAIPLGLVGAYLVFYYYVLNKIFLQLGIQPTTAIIMLVSSVLLVFVGLYKFPPKPSGSTKTKVLTDSKLMVRYGNFDEVVYVLACVFSLGSIWLMRIIISEGIRHAFDSMDTHEEREAAPAKEPEGSA